MYRILFCAALLLCSLSTPALAASAAAVKGVPNTDLTRYWTPSSKPFYPTLRGDMRGVRMAEMVQLEYTIDKRGRVREVTVLAFSPDDSRPGWAVDAIKAQRYTRAESNPDATPIRTETTVRMQPLPAR